jgi:enoyl-CoA hydratase
MAYNTILVEKLAEEKMAVIKMNRPEARNAIDYIMRHEMYLAVAELEGDKDVRAVIITGGNEVFSAGADIAAMLEFSAHDTFNRLSLWELVNKMERSRKPYIAAIAGFSLGGGNELAMACDVRVAAESAKFGQTEINVGIVPGGGGLSRIARLVGMGKAKELVMTGKIIPAQEALDIGLINQVVPDDKLMEEAIKMAKLMTRHSPVAVYLAKYALNNAENMDTHTAESIENCCFSLAFASNDQKEAMRAFLEKRKPEYTGT